jgi:Xaa-Pro aminopeptidase
MQTLHPVLKRGGLFWDRQTLPEEVFRGRLASVQAAIAESGDEAWLIYGDAQRYGHLAYVTHFLPRLRSAAVIVPRDGEPTLLAAIGSRDVPASKILTWVDDLRPFSRLPAEIAKCLEERGLTGAPIGVVGTRGSLPIAEWSTLTGSLPNVRWSERDDRLRELRATKHLAERNAIRRAAKVIEKGLETAKHALRPGLSVAAVTAFVDREMRRLAAEDVRILVASGPEVGTALHPPNERVLEADDVVILFLGAEVQRHWAEGEQTYVLGPIPPALRSISSRAAQAVHAMESELRPGAPASAAAAAAKRVLSEDLWASAEAYGLGHGIGLDIDELPLIREDSPDTVGRDQAIALHVVVHAGGYGVAVGQTSAVGATDSAGLISAQPLVSLHEVATHHRGIRR